MIEHGPGVVRDTLPVVFGGLAVLFATFFAQRAIVKYEIARKDENRAWDDFLKPLQRAVVGAAWDVDDPGWDGATRRGWRWGNLAPIRDLVDDISSHRIARLISPELAQTRVWLAAEQASADLWRSSLAKHGGEGQGVFAFAASTPSAAAADLTPDVARIVLSGVGVSSASDEIIARTVEAASDPRIWGEALEAAAAYGASVLVSQQRHRETVAVLAAALARGKP